MEKYQKLFITRIAEKFQRWEQQSSISEKELYRFLHSIKGTAGSIGLDVVSTYADSLLKNIDEFTIREWQQSEWKPLIYDIEQLIRGEHQVKQAEILSDKQKQDEGSHLILLVDHTFALVTELKAKLEVNGFMVLVALNAEKALQIYYEQKPDCMILSTQLPEKDGFEVLQIINNNTPSLFTPILLISDIDNEELRIKAYTYGAVDFIPKSFSFEELYARITNRLAYKDLVSKAVLVDELTGAFNRKFFHLEMGRQIQELTRVNQVFCLVIIDLDLFKKINDTHGHMVGDQVLKGFSAFMSQNKRQSDFLIRFGGEEFILILPKTNKSEAIVIVERLLKGFRQHEFLAEDNKFFVTFSAGIVEVNEENKTINQYLAEADQALYEAKQNGRNRVHVYKIGQLPNVEHEKIIHIGIIDDDPVIHQIVSDQMRKITQKGHQLDVKVFREGESFFQSDWLKQKGKYLILLDGMMPRMDGLEVLQKIRSDYNEKQFLVLMLTGRKSEKDIVRALELGADDYITKPFSMAELQARVKRLLVRVII